MATIVLDWFKLLIDSFSITYMYVDVLYMCTHACAPLSNCIHARMCTLHLDAQEKYGKCHFLTGAYVIAGLKRGFGGTWDELVGSESCV